MFEYVLIVYVLNDFRDPEYVGHFKNCDIASQYQEKYYSNHKSSKCLLKEYIVLPDDLEIIHIDETKF